MKKSRKKDRATRGSDILDVKKQPLGERSIHFYPMAWRERAGELTRCSWNLIYNYDVKTALWSANRRHALHLIREAASLTSPRAASPPRWSHSSSLRVSIAAKSIVSNNTSTNETFAIFHSTYFQHYRRGIIFFFNTLNYHLNNFLRYHFLYISVLL